MACSQEEFRSFVAHIPNLCTRGLTTAEYCQLFNIDFEHSRLSLADAYQDFLDCCRWLLDCQLDLYATHFSPRSEKVLGKVSGCLGRQISHGTLVAAVLYLDLPHVLHGNSPGISVGISRFCCHYHRSPISLKPIAE